MDKLNYDLAITKAELMNILNEYVPEDNMRIVFEYGGSHLLISSIQKTTFNLNAGTNDPISIAEVITVRLQR